MISTGQTQPAWVSTLAQPNTLYEIGEPMNTYAWKAKWPPGITGSDIYFYSMIQPPWMDGHDDWQGMVHVEDVGPFGRMVIGGSGENQLDGNSTCLDPETGDWDVWDDPVFETSEAAAAAADADMYLDKDNEQWSSLRASRATFMPTGWSDLGPWAPEYNETTWYNAYAAWLAMWRQLPENQRFPIATAGNWIFRRKFTNCGTLGYNRPWTWRYNSHCYIPPSMTGTGAGAMLRQARYFKGPFNSHTAWDMLDHEWHANVAPGSFVQATIIVQNTQTKEFSVLPVPLPYTGQWRYDPPPSRSMFVDRVSKRVYVTGPYFSSWCYLDFSNGIANVTASPGWTNMTTVGNYTLSSHSDGSNSWLCTANGRRLAYFISAHSHNTLSMWDMDNNTVRQLGPLPGMNMPYPAITEYSPVGCNGGYYDPVANKNVITSWWIDEATTPQYQTGAYSHVFTTPPGNDAYDASKYSVTSTKLALAPGVSYANPNKRKYFHVDRCKMHPSLNSAIFLTNGPYKKTLVYRPY
jgi:hypothetical protein